MEPTVQSVEPLEPISAQLCHVMESALCNSLVQANPYSLELSKASQFCQKRRRQSTATGPRMSRQIRGAPCYGMDVPDLLPMTCPSGSAMACPLHARPPAESIVTRTVVPIDKCIRGRQSRPRAQSALSHRPTSPVQLSLVATIPTTNCPPAPGCTPCAPSPLPPCAPTRCWSPMSCFIMLRRYLRSVFSSHPVDPRSADV